MPGTRDLPKIYAAVLYEGDLPGSSSTASSDCLKSQREPLLRVADSTAQDEQQEQRPSTSPSCCRNKSCGSKAGCFAVGALLGIAFSVAGFYLQEVYHFRHILWYSLCWSCLTSASAYVAFYFWTVSGSWCCYCRADGTIEDEDDTQELLAADLHEKLEVTEY